MTPSFRFAALAGLLALDTGCVVIPIGDLLKGPSLEEQVLIQGGGLFSLDKIAIIDIDGMITGDEGGGVLLAHDNTVAETKARLNRARRDPEVRAVVLRISTPGGEVTACDVIHHEVLKFRKDTGLPVIASIGDQGTSGGYYIAVAADSILANPTAVVGSIGVVLQHLDLTSLLQKVGVAFTPIKSSDKKDLNSPFRPMTGEEQAILQDLVGDMFQRFVDVVDEGRPGLDRDQVTALADGRVVSGMDAASLKLVDRTGYLSDAIEEARVRARIDSPTIVRYTRLPRSGANIYSGAFTSPPSAAGEISLSLRSGASPGPKLYYLWQPGS